jgi:hypothetical protein
MPLTYQQIRSAVIDYVRSNPAGQIPARVDVFVGPNAHDCVTDRDREIAREVFHELYLERVVITGASFDSINAQMVWPFYTITEFGKQVLCGDEYQPHDRDGYVAKLKSQIPTLDPDSIRYLDESLQCFERGVLLASAVMLGCAAEKVALLLVDAFGHAIHDAALKRKYERETDHWMISRKYEALWKRLEPLSSKLPKELSADLHTVLDRVFDLIRTTRNHAGHPTGKIIEREAMRANLLLFPSYCRRVYGLIEYFSSNPV